ncbi:MAG: DUF5063 domain-containing protein [Prevotellaceae bacterium]|jgi:hypothetical protein|nr:DUF5063 domain-containing protein [Prevotellaceae bacterium]
MEEHLPNHYVYSPNVIEFVTVVAETCLFLERLAEHSPAEFVDKSVKILPLLYLKASLVGIPERELDEEPERFVTEDDYRYLCEGIARLLGKDDSYLEVFHPDMAYSDAPVAAFISENIADIYQELKDFAANYRLGEEEIMNDALAVCLDAFGEHWGQKLLGTLRALHALRYDSEFGEDEKGEKQDYPKIDRNRFLNYQATAP